ncbi:class III extradiol dioxygenase subunit B-like domain-containing protein [Streptomyces sp. CC208A]|uniref:class III extradiol dioxygenase subunit B-like domain-containing protein n=1 Tax=Streptomyces sp. CC208A TaxID=3044573 RepID=UPI0024A9F5D8|nr:class III extradiol dioxygenase subunit B-like domain-containing protein [Streptomyces sp. CC208A]
MLVAAAVCPCPPLLVPEVAGGAAPELEDARAHCADALGVLAAARPDRLYVVGPAPEGARGAFPAGSTGSFAGFGVDLAVSLGQGPGGRTLPASLAVGAWLLSRTDRPGAPGASVAGFGVDERATAEECAEAGRRLAASAERVALLVMGDGSACRTVKAPGYLDERAAGFDAEAARALGSADVPGLLALDAGLAYELKAAGRAPWQVLAGAAEGTGLGGRLLHEEAPYGVEYLVAVWS